MAQIVTIGEILVEIMATRIGQTFLEPGLFAGPYPSGAPAIFADQAARVGAATAMIGCVGPDDFGTLNLDRLRRQRCRGGARSAACPAPPPAARSSPTAPTAAATSSTTSPTRLRPHSTQPTRTRDCSAAAVTSTSWAPRCSAPRSRGGSREASNWPRRGCPDLVRPQHSQGAAGTAGRRGDHRRRACGDRPPAAERGRSRPSLPRAGRGAGAGSLLDAGRSMVLLKKGALGSVYRIAEQRIATPAFPARGGRSDRCGGLLRRHLRRLPRARRADRACPAPRQRGRRAGGGQEGADGGQLDHGRARGLPGQQP